MTAEILPTHILTIIITAAIGVGATLLAQWILGRAEAPEKYRDRAEDKYVTQREFLQANASIREREELIMKSFEVRIARMEDNNLRQHEQIFEKLDDIAEKVASLNGHMIGRR